MKQISLDNGRSFMDPDEALELVNTPDNGVNITWDVIVSFMAESVLEEVHREAPETELEFLTRYLQLANDDLIIG